MIYFSKIHLISSTLAALGYAALATSDVSPKSIIDISTDVFGPLNTWRPVRAI
jgi:hypothetical protein